MDLRTTRRKALGALLGFAATRVRLNAEDQALSLPDFESLAHSHISHGAWERIQGGAADELTVRWNREAYQHIRLRPRVLVDVSKLDTRIKLLGHDLPFPILLAPTGAQGFVYPDGDLVTARGAGAAQAILVISSSASLPVDQVARAATGAVWFQLYVQKDRGFTRDLVQRAENAGCRAICVTVDSPTHGTRNREEHARGELPERPLPNLRGKDYLDPTLTWKDIEWLTGITKLPVLVKGILRSDDALLAVNHGASGVIVSNHGARQLDATPATISILPEIVDAVGGKVEVYVDGGIRRGTDVLKAIACGARAVFIGRPVLWGLASGAEAGVRYVLEMMRQEFDLAMALSGCPTLSSITRDLIRRL